jgi:hypothetical protein
MRRGVNPRFTMLRKPACRSPSSAMRLRAVVNSSGLSRVCQTNFTRNRSIGHESGVTPPQAEAVARPA